MPLEVSASGKSGLAQNEYGASQEDITAAVASCAGRTLSSLSEADREKLKQEIEGLKSTIAKARDITSSQYSRLSQSEERLAKEASSIGDGTANFTAFHSMAGKAGAFACDEVFLAGEVAKEAVDVVYSRENEIAYRVRLVSQLKLSLSSRISDFDAATLTLTNMANAIS